MRNTAIAVLFVAAVCVASIVHVMHRNDALVERIYVEAGK